MRVLVAEASRPTRTLVQAALEQDGCVVVEADTVAGAVDAAARDRPEVCLLDTELPGGATGALRALLRIDPPAAVVMFAGEPDAADFLAFVEAGASGYLPKDIDPSRLSLALRQAADGEAAVPRALVPLLIDALREQARRRALPLVSDLTSREFEVLHLMSRGMTTRAIAERLYVAEVTVRTHIASIVRKLGVADRESAIRALDRS